MYYIICLFSELRQRINTVYRFVFRTRVVLKLLNWLSKHDSFRRNSNVLVVSCQIQILWMKFQELGKVGVRFKYKWARETRHFQ